MVDQTIYFLDDHTPELAVRQIFGRQRSPSKLCLLFAGLGLLTLDCIVHLGEDPATVRKTFTRIIDGDNKLGSDLDEQYGNWLTILAIWQSCKRLVYAAAARHAKILEDPASCPALPHDDHVDFRAQFVLAHPDIILVDCREPHKLFVEMISVTSLFTARFPFTKLTRCGSALIPLFKEQEWIRLRFTASSLLSSTKMWHNLFCRRIYGSPPRVLRGAGIPGHLRVLCQGWSDHVHSGAPGVQAGDPDLFRLFWADKIFRTKVARLTSVDRCTSSPRHSCTRSWVDPGPIGSGLSVMPAGSKQPALRLPLLPVKASGSLAQFLKTLRSLRRQVFLCRSSRRPSVFEAQETEEYCSSS